MDAIETLMSEHRLIEQVIGALHAFARDASPVTAPSELRPYVTFIQEFADGAHHGKEENILFAALIAAGFPTRGGPVGMMLHEHELGRAYVRALDALASKSAWTPDDCGEVLAAAAGYGELMLAHIQKEDNVLYPMARMRLDVGPVDASCAAADEARVASGNDARLRALARQLVARRAA